MFVECAITLEAEQQSWCDFSSGMDLAEIHPGSQAPRHPNTHTHTHRHTHKHTHARAPTHPPIHTHIHMHTHTNPRTRSFGHQKPIFHTHTQKKNPRKNDLSVHYNRNCLDTLIDIDAATGQKWLKQLKRAQILDHVHAIVCSTTLYLALCLLSYMSASARAYWACIRPCATSVVSRRIGPRAGARFFTYLVGFFVCLFVFRKCVHVCLEQTQMFSSHGYTPKIMSAHNRDDHSHIQVWAAVSDT